MVSVRPVMSLMAPVRPVRLHIPAGDVFSHTLMHILVVLHLFCFHSVILHPCFYLDGKPCSRWQYSKKEV